MDDARGEAAVGEAARQHRVWETIATSFDRTRNRAWPHVAAFLRDLPPGARVLDVMAGNGRHTKAILDAGLHAIALDWSRPVMRLVQPRYPKAHVAVAEASQLPLAQATIDAAIFVAGLHSIPKAEERQRSLSDLRRVMRPAGLAQVTVWSRNAPRFRQMGLPEGPTDVAIPWRAEGHDEQRFYHLYTPQSLHAAAVRAGWTVLQVVEISVAEPDDNIVALLRA